MKLYFFYRNDCAPCHEVKPVVQALAEEMRVPLVWINAETNLSAVGVYRVKSVPTVIVLDDKDMRVAGFTGRMIEPDRIRRFLGVA